MRSRRLASLPAAALLLVGLAACSPGTPTEPAPDPGQPTDASPFEGEFTLTYSDGSLVGSVGLSGVSGELMTGEPASLALDWSTSNGSSGLESQLPETLTITCLLGECLTTPGAGSLVVGDPARWDPYVHSTIGGLIDGCPGEVLLEEGDVRAIETGDDGTVTSFEATIGMLYNVTWGQPDTPEFQDSGECGYVASVTATMTATRVP